MDIIPEKWRNDIIPEKWRNRWSSNEEIVLVLASLGVQIGLVFLAPLRKRSTNIFFRLIIWLLYLTADNVAILALGNISAEANPAESGCSSGAIPGKLTVLWAPFLLLHLGGPDSITSFSLEDNELWGRHLLGLVSQVITTVYVLWRSPPKRWMWVPTMLVFIPGLIKFSERTQALRLGSNDYLIDQILSEISPKNDSEKVGILSEMISNSPRDSERKIEDNHIDRSINSPRNSERKIEDNHIDRSISEHGDIPANETKVELSERESQTICEGYAWIYFFKRLLIDVTFSSNLLMQSHDRFSNISARDALNLVSIELSFLYDILHTKAVHMHNNLGRVLRCISLVSVIAALIVFRHLDKQNYPSKDIIITYILLDVGIILEVFSVVLLLSSDWTVASLRNKDWRRGIAHSITKMVKRITFMKGKSRWSNTIGQYNLVDVCLRDRYTPRTWIMKKLFIVKHIWDNKYETKFIPLPKLLEDIMFTVAMRRAQNVHIYSVLLEASSYRGNKALERHGELKKLEWSMKREFVESILLWHIATDICYYNETSNQPKGNDTERDVSWKTSNYMFYLLTQQQLGYSKTQFHALCAVVKKKFIGNGPLDHKEACNVLVKNEVLLLPPEQTNAPVPADGRQPGWKCWGRRKGKEDKRKNEAVPPVPEQNEEDAPVPDSLLPDDGRQHGWRCWAKRKGKYEEDAPVPEQTNAPDDGRQHGWRCWAKRKSKDEEVKLKDKENMARMVLKDSCRLAKELQELNEEIKWKLISETWMEMMGYAAIHCGSYYHLNALRRGGELLTHLWLLMAHLGVVDVHKVQQYESGSV